MKKPLIIVIVLIVIGLIVWSFGGKEDASVPVQVGTLATSSTPIKVSETTKVSEKLSEYKNEELGLSVKYPSVWKAAPVDTGVNFIIPITKADTNTVTKLESRIVVTSGKCSFPPVTTVKERKTVKVGNLSFSMISMSNSVQGRDYFDRMYSLQQNTICYTFSFSSVASSPASKGLKGSEATQATNNNKAIIDTADQAFTDMVKSFTYVVGPQGQDETKVRPATTTKK